MRFTARRARRGESAGFSVLAFVRRLLAGSSAVLVLGLLVGCAGTDTAADGGEEAPEETRPVAPSGDPNVITAPVAPAPANVKTVQLYRSGDESSLPIIGLGSGETLTLEFDLVRTRGRSFSVYFYHADRRWRYDLQPAQYMRSFARDDLIDYTSSRGTRVSYTHYSYRYPNDDIRFTESGNYVVRVAEQGSEGEVLFERAFFVSEQAVEPALDVEAFRIGAGGRLAPRPSVRFPASNLLQNHPFDVNVCFMRNGHVGEIRCASDPTLIEASFYQFRLPLQESFSVESATRVLDLSALQESSQIVGVDFQTTPIAVTLARDYARFTGPDRGKLLTGRTLVESVVRNTFDPDTQGEYVQVRFGYVPVSEERLDGSLMVTGSFNGWQFEQENRLSWLEGEGTYEGTVLVKQGMHEYRYYGTGEPVYRDRSSLQENLYTALVYYHDPTLDTDRLIAVSNAVGR